ncbi:MAG TPA: hypothetical protein VFZ52_15790 [Chryseolinea sp.]
MTDIKVSREGNKRNVFFKEAGRVLVYGVIVFLAAELMRWNAANDEFEDKFSEFSYVEYMQSLLLFLCATICLWFYLSKNTTSFKFIFLLTFGFSSAAFIREQDIYFEQVLGDGTWPYPVYLILGFVVYKTYKGRFEAWEHIVQYLRTKSYAFMTFGMITILIFSRLFGRTIFWQTVMEERYFRSVKNVSEECLELYGYLFLCFAVVELVILVQKNQKS